MSKTWLEQWTNSCRRFLGLGDDDLGMEEALDEYLVMRLGGEERDGTPEELPVFRRIAPRAALEDRMLQHCDELLTVEEQCGSPIERVMLSALIVAGARSFSSITLRSGEDFWDRRRSGYQPMGAVAIEPQAEVGPYRADFLMTASDDIETWCINNRYGVSIEPITAQVVVECDGHEFHEKTKEQASRDKARDREFQKLGYTVFRYSGSDIWADVFSCAEEVTRHLKDRLRQRGNEIRDALSSVPAGEVAP